ncbi:hypothetical protein A0J61_10336 [Choanephora cucurbitarum]|uniref:Uncharacterized protein n=1 Tax=Choanephora cucurbitarum TaxID=101091 RepID=A0A1C7MXW9_9FUNG|nr:hypothetical protein A0J61_10336 [Choanephora cucurbitarum]
MRILYLDVFWLFIHGERLIVNRFHIRQPVYTFKLHKRVVENVSTGAVLITLELYSITLHQYRGLVQSVSTASDVLGLTQRPPHSPGKSRLALVSDTVNLVS